MAVHWNPAVTYKPQNEAEEDMMLRKAFSPKGKHKPRCPLCKKRQRSPGHYNVDRSTCLNGK